MQLSEDGKWMWNGTEWVPAETAAAPAALVAPTPIPVGVNVTDGVFSGDIHHTTNITNVQQSQAQITEGNSGKTSDKFIGILGILQGMAIIGLSVWLVMMISDIQIILEDFVAEFDECRGDDACDNWIDGMNSTMMTWKVLHGIGIAVGMALIFFSSKMFTASEGRRKGFFFALGGAVVFFFIVGFVEYNMYNSMMEDTEEFTEEEQDGLGLWETNGMIQFFSNTCCFLFVGLLALLTMGKKEQQLVVVQQQMPQMYQ